MEEIQRPIAQIIEQAYNDDFNLGFNNMLKEVIDNMLDATRGLSDQKMKIKLDNNSLIFADNGSSMLDIVEDFIVSKKKKRRSIGRRNLGGFAAIIGFKPEELLIYTKPKKHWEIAEFKIKSYMEKVNKVKYSNYKDARSCDFKGDHLKDKLKIPQEYELPYEFNDCKTIFKLTFDKEQFKKIEDLFKNSKNILQKSYKLPHMTFQDKENYLEINNSNNTEENKNNRFIDFNDFKGLDIQLNIFKKKQSVEDTDVESEDTKGLRKKRYLNWNTLSLFNS